MKEKGHLSQFSFHVSFCAVQTKPKSIHVSHNKTNKTYINVEWPRKQGAALEWNLPPLKILLNWSWAVQLLGNMLDYCIPAGYNSRLRKKWESMTGKMMSQESDFFFVSQSHFTAQLNTSERWLNWCHTHFMSVSVRPVKIQTRMWTLRDWVNNAFEVI